MAPPPNSVQLPMPHMEMKEPCVKSDNSESYQQLQESSEIFSALTIGMLESGC